MKEQYNERSQILQPTIVCRTRAFTVLELLCVIAIIAILAAIVLPSISQAKARAKRLACVEQLHQAGIAFTAFAHEHDGKLPMAVPAQAGGSLEFAQPAAYGISDSSSFHHFQTLADELRTPRMVVCPADTRVPATNFVTLRNENVSYLVGLNAQLINPNSVLAGDRNITSDYTPASCCVLRLDAGAAIRWTRELHEFKGNLLFADSRVEQSNDRRLAATGFKVAYLMLPTLEFGNKAGEPNPVARPTFPANLAAANQVAPVSAGPSTAKPVRATSSMEASDLTTTGNELVQAPIPVSLKIPNALSNPSAWLLPKEQAPDPGFTLFPQSVSLIPKALVRKSVWPLWALLVLLVAGLLTRFKWLGNRE